MKKGSLWIITGLMTVALIGVFIMQVYYIKQAYVLRTQLFEQNVNNALTAVSEKVQRLNTVGHIEQKKKEFKQQHESNIRGQTEKIVDFKEKFRANEDLRKYRQQQTTINYLSFQIQKIRENYITPLSITEAEYQTLYNKTADIVESLDLRVNEGVTESGKVIRQLFPRDLRRLQSIYTDGKLPDTIRYIAISPQDLSLRFISLSTTDKDLETKFSIEDANAKKKYALELERLYADTSVVTKSNIDLIEDVQKEMQLSDIPISKRISKSTLNGLIRSELINQGIPDLYDFWVSLARKDSVIFASNRFSIPKSSNNVIHYKPNARMQSGDEETLVNVHKTVLFRNDVIRDPGMLYVRFPNQGASIIKNMGITLGSSFGFLLLLIFIFTYTIYSIIRQKKISEMKSDFINNMTHEFKTPVATIMLASEALKDPETMEDKNRVAKLANIIYDENIRLGDHIERVLSIARIENKQLQLSQNTVNLNDLVIAVTDSMALQLANKNTHLTLALNATNPILESDELHLSNVLFNLIDNANKYSKESPKIAIGTFNDDKGLVLEVTDEGIGMTKEQTKRIFDQFYRVPTGNLHDVKGFGLGLNYVQDIVNQIQAKITVFSEKDKGTTFRITFPKEQSS